MGTWGTGLFQNDFAADLAADFKQRLAISPSQDQAIANLIEQSGADFPPSDADSSGFWLALADLLHQYGLKDDAITERASNIIADGTDLRLLKRLEMSDADLKARARLLTKLPDKWASPPARVKEIPVLKPEPFLMEAGDVIAYPTMDFNPRWEPIGTVAKATYRFVPDAENAFVCVARARVHFDLEARYFIVPLLMFYEHSPITLADCLERSFLTEFNTFDNSFAPLGGWSAMRKKYFKQIDARAVGRVTPDLKAFESAFGETVRSPEQRYDVKSDVLIVRRSVFDTMQRGGAWGDVEDILGSYVKD